MNQAETPPHHALLPPRALAIGLGLAAVAVLAVFLLPHGTRADGETRGRVERQRQLSFTDRDDGAVVATDTGNGAVVAVIAGPSGFLRGTMSGLARMRRTEGIGADLPFRLTLYADHRLVLDDPATGSTVELEAFGPTNEAVFAGLLPP